jgi:hypothetical protein
VVEIVCVPVEPWHIEHVAEHMRAADVKECRVLGDLSPRDALERSVTAPGDCWTAMFDGEPSAIFGVSTDTIMGGGIGTAWLLGSTRLERDWRAFARASRPVLAEIMMRYPVVSNVMLAENILCVRWLKWLGASFRIHGPFARFLLCAART